MFEIEEIYEFIPQGMFADVNEFKTYANQNGIEDFYDYMPTGMFANVDEFTQGLKKKEDTGLPGEDTSLVQPQLEEQILDLAITLPVENEDFALDALNEESKNQVTQIAQTNNLTPEDLLEQVKQKKVENSQRGAFSMIYNSLLKADRGIAEGIASIPSSIYRVGALISDPVNRALGLPETDLEKFEETIGTRSILEELQEEQRLRDKEGELYAKQKNIEQGLLKTLKKGNYEDFFFNLGNVIGESVPFSISIMMGGAAGIGMKTIGAAGTAVLAGPEIRRQEEENPTQTKAENVFKGLGMAGAEMVFSTITQGTLGKAYADIIKKEGIKQGSQTFKNGLIKMYYQAVRKTGLVATSAGEGIEEVATQITQNLIDGRPVYEGVPDAFIGGMGGGGFFGAPISANNAVKSANEAVARYNIKKTLKPSGVNSILDAFKSKETTNLQLELGKIKRAPQILDAELRKQINNGSISEQEAADIKLNLFETQTFENKVSKLKLNEEQKIKTINLLKEKASLEEVIKEVNEASLTTKQQQRVDEINKLLEEITDGAIQVGSTTKVDVQEQARDGEELGEGDPEGETPIEDTSEEIESTEVPEVEIENLTEEQQDEVGDLEYSLGITEEITVDEETIPTLPQDLTVEQAVEQGRELGFSEPAIKAVLLKRGFKASEINPVMESGLKKGETIPQAFRNIEGGLAKGVELFRTINRKLNRFRNTKNKKTKQTPTRAEVRKRALEILKAEKVYNELSEIEQQEVILAFDKVQGTRANRAVQEEINAIKKLVRGFKQGVKDLRGAQIKLKNFVRQNLKQPGNLLPLITNIKSAKDLPAQAEQVIKRAEAQLEKTRKALVSEIAKLTRTKSKKRITGSKKVRAKSLSAEGQQFFQAANRIIRAALGKNPIDDMAKISNELADLNEIDRVLKKERDGEKLTTQESTLLDTVAAFDLLADINDKTVEELEQIREGLKDVSKESIQRLRQQRNMQAMEADKLRKEADESIEEDYEMLYKTDSEGNKVLKTDEDIEQEREQIWNDFNRKKTWSNFRKVFNVIRKDLARAVSSSFRIRLAHLDSLTKVLDSFKRDGFFTRQIYDKVNVAYENSLQGNDLQQQVLNNIANTIEGITKGYAEIYSLLNKGAISLKIKGKRTDFTADNLLRIYALSLNEIQKNKLNKQGYTDKVLNEIKEILGPQLTEFADKTVEYLSSDYYESVNDVYKNVNNVNLNYVPNYFPTKTKVKLDSKLLEDGDFSKIFSAENSPALKTRTDTTTDIDIGLGLDFTGTLNNHIQQMERYKAYAQTVKDINTVFNTDSVRLLLQTTGVEKLIRQAVNFEINPNYGIENLQTGFINRLQRNYTSFALAFRVIQIAKQSTSFINAFEEYQFRKGKTTPVLDHIGFMIDMAKVIATLPSQIKKAKGISANFRNRLAEGLGGDIYGLEAGARMKEKRLSRKKYAQLVQAFRTGAASPTVLGDVIGVMGYMANYNRNIANGMDKKEALKAFNNYNATQQSRRNSDKIPLQRDNNELIRAFTMFGSTLFLQMNKVASSSSGIYKALTTKGRKVNPKDVRALALNLGAANVLFVVAANIGKLIEGNDDDRREVYVKMLEAAIGLNLIYQVPLIGGGVEGAVEYMKAEVFELPFARRNRKVSDIVNPFSSIFGKMTRYLESDDPETVVIPLIELAIGAQVDPVIGLYNYFKDFEFDEEEYYEMLGIGKSYRPRKKGGPRKRKKSSDPNF